MNSAILTSPSWSIASSSYELRFQHKYDIEDIFDGGILEISINGGAWTEWTAAGGSFSANGYDGVVNALVEHPLAGLSAWMGDSGGFAQTIAQFPAGAVGQNVEVRWHQGSDAFTGGQGWWIDDIQIIDTVGSSLPQLTVAVSVGPLEELHPSTNASFVINSAVDVSSNLSVAYTVAGDASSGNDYVALAGSATILSGQSSVSIPVTVIADSDIEGDETITINLTSSANYGILTGSADLTIKDLPFDDYREAAFGTATLNIAEDEDFDFDGLLNLVEYAFRLDAASASALPFSLQVNDSGSPVLELVYYEDTELEDVTYVVETSTTLEPESWTTAGVTITDGSTVDGLLTRTASIPIGSTPGFLRIRVERIVP